MPVSTAGRVKDANQALKGLLDANGISEKAYNEDPTTVKSIEMFLFNFSKIQSLDAFTGLTSLFICQQAIPEIEGLDLLVNLEQMWLIETNISKIKGLDTLSKMKKLYLYSNRIKKIENIAHMWELHTLSLMDNEIEEITGLERLENLTSLNLAQNRIREIGSTLDSNTGLVELNLAGNDLWSFKDLLNLTRAANLRKLAFNDPDYGDNPVCELCNYQTYVFFHLQQLTFMDTIPIPDEGKQLAEATYMKKKMYYNMRIKTLKRNTTNINRKAKDAFLTRKNALTLTLNALVRQRKDLERIMHAHESKKQGVGEVILEGLSTELQDQEAIKKKLKLLDEAIERKVSEIQDTEQMVKSIKTQVCSISDYNTSRLIVELETGGNIRLEDGKPSDVWYSSCVDLVNSRFFQGDFQPYGISDLAVTRVTRIHNRFLRNRFEEKLEGLVDTSDSTYKRSLEYLFYGQDPRLPGEIMRVAEEGFRTSEYYGKLGMDAAVSLSNSVSIADIPRINDSLVRNGYSVNADGTPKNRIGLNMPSGQLLITKVFLARCTAEKTGKDPKDEGDAEDGEVAPALINKSQYPKHESVFRVRAADAKQRTWFVFDHCLVLPEYLVEFEYVMKHTVSPDPPMSFMTQLVEKGILHPQNETEASDMGPLARALVKFLYQCDQKAAVSSSGSGPHDDVTTRILSTPPIVEVQGQGNVTEISLDLITTRCGSDFSAITYLNLHSNHIRKIENLEGLHNLETLILSFNEVTKIENMDMLTALRTLDLSFNMLRRIENMKMMSTLTTLAMNSNLLHRTEDLSLLRKYVPHLVSLNLSNNLLCDMKSYRHYVLRRLCKLETLDDRPVTASEQQAALANTSSIKTAMIKENAFVQRRSNWSLLPANLRRQQLSDKELLQTDDDTDESWWERVQDLELNHRHLRKLSNLERLVNLKVLSVCDNEIVSIQGLEQCVLLEELLMEENRVAKIENLSALVHLKKLDLGKNKISRIEGLDALVSLVQLSLEDNEIESLAGLSKVSTLLELYLGNNKVAQMREVLQLRPLPKLIILDLSGNPVCDCPEYRLYTIFHVKKLKVLDGLGVESGEQAAANETYSGRLTEEFVIEKLGHKFFDHVSELDLSSNKIRDTANCITGDTFCNLRVLNLDNNMISDLSSLSGLSVLAVLRLNHNRIESLGPEKPPRNGFESRPPCGLQTMTALEVLQLGFNDIHSLAGCRNLPFFSLKVLFLQGNDISRLEGLETLSQVRELVLDKNKIRHVDFGSLLPLVNLRELRVEENGLKSLSNFAPLPRLQSLHLGSNRITDMSEMDKLTSLPCLLDCTLANNPLARKQLYRATAIQKLPFLRILDNKEITTEERDRVDVLFAMETRTTPQYLAGSAAAHSHSHSSSHSQHMHHQNSLQGAIGKVPIKMSSMNFDQLGGPMSHGIGGGLGGGAHQSASFLCIGLSKNSEQHRAESEWHPFHNSTGDFFLPAGKMSGRTRAGSGQGGSGDGGGGDSDAAPGWLQGALDRRSSPQQRATSGDRLRAAATRPRSGDRPAPKSMNTGGLASGSAAAVASAALEARALAAGMPGQQRSRKLGYMLSGGSGNPATPRGRHSSPLNSYSYGGPSR